MSRILFSMLFLCSSKYGYPLAIKDIVVSFCGLSFMTKEFSSYIVVWQTVELIPLLYFSPLGRAFYTDVFCDYLSDCDSCSSSGSETDSIKASKPTSREVYLTVE